jgi:protoporphyrinogen oxidase
MTQKTAIIIGAGPAGLTAAYELLTRTDIKPIVLEADDTYVGGISKTIVYKGNRIDIGGHRFFSKSDRVMRWWFSMLPLQKTDDATLRLAYRGQEQNISVEASSVDPEQTDRVMLVRDRLSRIYFDKTFFPYPVTLSVDVLRKLGPVKVLKIGVTYVYRRLFPIRPEHNLEEFFLNRFGDELYKTFFRSYTEKVWGKACRDISAEWGAQRIKGLSITEVLRHGLKKLFSRKDRDLEQKTTETSLIERFFYPKLGPGQMWETVADIVREKGGEIHMNARVSRIESEGTRVTDVVAQTPNGEVRYQGDYVFSTMAIRDLIRGMGSAVPSEVQRVANGLEYRDFITVGLLLKKLAVHDPAAENRRISDNWIYVHDPDVLVGRLQLFNNWSKYLVQNGENIWMGMEYFCNEGDELWRKTDEEMIALGTRELAKIGMIDPADVIDGTVIHERKTYPAYFGTYHEFDNIRSFIDAYENLFLIGRNGMHRYNNQDHSMLTAMTAVDNILAGIVDKTNLWSVNTEQEYHEEKK